MQLESHATPPQETPQQRYATLHRAIERGLESDEIWRDLADVSLKIGHTDEAIDCLRRIRNGAVHKIVESHLVRIGVLPDPATRRQIQRRNPGAPAASHAGPGGKETDWSDVPGLREHVVDALQYLGHQHMPWLVLVTTLAFPILVGLGGFLTVGGSPLLLAAIAAIPGLCVVAVVGAMGRQILLASSGGSGDVPNVPELNQLVVDARKFLADTGLVLGTLIAPSIAAMAFGVPLTTVVPCLLTGAFFAPIAWALRQVRGDFGALSPVTMMRAASRAGHSYFGLVPVCWLLFAPAAITASLIFDRPVWVQVAAIGPLCVVPLFVVSRLLGTWLDTKRLDLAGVLTVAAAEREPTEAPAKPAPAKPAPAKPAQPAVRTPRKPEALEDFKPPNVKRPGIATTAARQAAQAVRSTPAPAPRAAAPAAQRSAAQRAKPQASAPATGAQRQTQTTQVRRTAPNAAASVREDAGQGLDDQPDLTQMPGAVVLTGADRQRHGAAARTRR